MRFRFHDADGPWLDEPAPAQHSADTGPALACAHYLCTQETTHVVRRRLAARAQSAAVAPLLRRAR